MHGILQHGIVQVLTTQLQIQQATNINMNLLAPFQPAFVLTLFWCYDYPASW